VPTPQELEQRFWKALKSDMTVMLGLDGVEDGHARPMTAQLEHDDRGPIFFFTAKDTEIVRSLSKGTVPLLPLHRKVTTYLRPSADASPSITIVP
jgi:general stress protein 26